MITIVPLPQTDQTLESLYAHTCLCNVSKTNQATLSALFGCSAIDFRSLTHKGVSRFFQVTGGMGYPAPKILLESHCYIPVYKGSLSPYEYSQQLARILDDRGASLNLRASSGTLVSSQVNFCPKCVETDLDIRNIAYARRSHQIVGVQVCNFHAVPLQTLDKSKSDWYSHRGLLIPRGENKNCSWTLKLNRANSLTDEALRYARLVNAAVSGKRRRKKNAPELIARLRNLEMQHRTPAVFSSFERLKDRFAPLITQSGWDQLSGSLEKAAEAVISAALHWGNPLDALFLESQLFVDDLEQ